MIGQAVGTDCDVPVLYDVTDIADMVVETRRVVIINATAESDVGVVAQQRHVPPFLRTSLNYGLWPFVILA
jgi:hypothetical protein